MDSCQNIHNANWKYCSFYIRWRWNRLSFIYKLAFVVIVILSVQVVREINQGLDAENHHSLKSK